MVFERSPVVLTVSRALSPFVRTPAAVLRAVIVASRVCFSSVSPSLVVKKQCVQ